MNLTETRDLLEMMQLAWPTLRVDADVASAWAAKLATVDQVTAHKAADALVDAGKQFPPTVADMVATCRRLAAQDARRHRATKPTCAECGGSGWIEVGRDRDANRVIPCQACLPQTHERWQSGRDGYNGPVYTGGRPRQTSTEQELSREGLGLARQALAEKFGRKA